MKQKFLFLITGLCLSVSISATTIQAEVILGTGTASLVGGDLTDPEDDGDPEADNGYNATFHANDEEGFGGGESAFLSDTHECGHGQQTVHRLFLILQ